MKLICSILLVKLVVRGMSSKSTNRNLEKENLIKGGGRRVDGHWVLGMVEDGSEDIRLEVCPDNARSAEVLIPLIRKHVVEGTTIHTDCWKAYDCLKDYGYVHRKVNHSDPENPFVAPDGTHTQRIESQWRVIKRISPILYQRFVDYLRKKVER
ncbi:uncharacterized protein LOC110118226 [Ceratitis capitata]|uniref:uncharacterized protein LOC110118226 n=1 Tax=Ceratitis capitata TaxID=7213 RepID=UPI000A0F9F61|nr:uncharacterized protein LOC110118226 [Ceratitis capitata]